ncbi:hypothetical protein [Sphingorhabdus sp. EL138]|uniref:hypothetical protein n=1 Tax=Sphingorhabdus sp. EL138 TaxID=2073156 RepID=UPI000D686797|nr:hypothetical protein [Sphingorhabdus sp. EL138]
MKVKAFLSSVVIFGLTAPASVAAAQSGKSDNGSIAGTWYNSYCSQVALTTGPGNLVQGTYTSHTGSTGSFKITGYVGVAANDPQKTNGTPVALSLHWRAINVDPSKGDGSWHWVSNFGGQYHPAQTVSVPGQKPYSVEETLEIMNMIIATSTVPGFNSKAPLMWPETIQFHKTPPSYCEPITPPPPISYKSEASDLVSGKWRTSAGDTLNLYANIEDGTVSGLFYRASGETYSVKGLVDNFSNYVPGVTIEEQGVSLSLYQTNGAASGLITMGGGVPYSNKTSLSLFTNDLSSTDWNSRFLESTVDKINFQRVGPN